MEIIKTIPRIRPTVTFKEIFLIMYNLFRSKNIGFQEVTISKFEEAFAARYDLPRGVCFSKARVAFYFLLKTMNLRPEGEVIISAIHVADFVNMIRLAGFRPVVVDLLPNNYTIDCEDLEKKLMIIQCLCWLLIFLDM